MEGACRALLDRRLDPDSPRPLAVAVSGGGDSVALALLADRWARAHGRPLLLLNVDHRLQAESAAWAQACATLAARLGAGFRTLAWDGPKPAAGLPAAARSVRHALLAEAARAAGARVLLMGHTADDVLEARAMRRAGSTTPEPRGWTASPAWPEGRGLFLLRPLIGIRRAALRAWLEAAGESWIDDPANRNPRFARARARAGLGATAPDPAPLEAPPSSLARLHRCDPAGVVVIARAELRVADLEAASRWLGLAAVCAGGGARPPARAARDRLSARLRGPEPVVATLAGARVTAEAMQVRLAREGGERRRGGLRPLGLRRGEPAAWDGRFEIIAAQDGLEVRALAGLAARLPRAQRRALAALPADVRPGLPAIVGPGDGVSCPLLGEAPAVAVELVAARLEAAAGLVEREPD